MNSLSFESGYRITEYRQDCKMISNILSRLSPYTCTDEIIGDHQCGSQCNRSTTDQTFCIHHILKKEWEYNETVHQLYAGFKKAYDSVRREVLYNTLIVWGTHETS
jgi:hypothetical protein